MDDESGNSLTAEDEGSGDTHVAKERGGIAFFKRLGSYYKQNMVSMSRYKVKMNRELAYDSFSLVFRVLVCK